jgi:hypothetical protein
MRDGVQQRPSLSPHPPPRASRPYERAALAAELLRKFGIAPPDAAALRKVWPAAVSPDTVASLLTDSALN